MKKQILITIALLFLLVGGIALSSTITEILGTDTISSSRTVINTNFNNLNGDKIENSSLFTVSTSTSRVGIGTTTPAYTLDVNGQLRVIATTTLGTTTITKLTATNASTTALSIASTTAGFLKADATGNVSTSTVDSSSGGTGTSTSAWTGILKITTGTWATSTILSNTISISYLNATATHNVEFSKQFAMTLTKVSCYSYNGSSTINIVDKGTAGTLASTTLSASLVCDTDGIASSTTFSLSAIQANDILDASTTAITGSPDTFIGINYLRTNY